MNEVNLSIACRVCRPTMDDGARGDVPHGCSALFCQQPLLPHRHSSRHAICVKVEDRSSSSSTAVRCTRTSSPCWTCSEMTTRSARTSAPCEPPPPGKPGSSDVYLICLVREGEHFFDPGTSTSTHVTAVTAIYIPFSIAKLTYGVQNTEHCRRARRLLCVSPAQCEAHNG